jgi:type I restriction-modification system DNA methylase subunit
VNHSEIVSFLWGVADLIRDTLKRGKYQDVILPLTVLRRLDCVLLGTKSKVLETQAKLKGKIEDLGGQSGTRRTARWGLSATRSTSTGTSTGTCRPARSKRSRPTSGR